MSQSESGSGEPRPSWAYQPVKGKDFWPGCCEYACGPSWKLRQCFRSAKRNYEGVPVCTFHFNRLDDHGA